VCRHQEAAQKAEEERLRVEEAAKKAEETRMYGCTLSDDSFSTHAHRHHRNCSVVNGAPRSIDAPCRNIHLLWVVLWMPAAIDASDEERRG
jgi:hypothetical protein